MHIHWSLVLSVVNICGLIFWATLFVTFGLAHLPISRMVNRDHIFIGDAQKMMFEFGGQFSMALLLTAFADSGYQGMGPKLTQVPTFSKYEPAFTNLSLHQT